MHRNHTHGEEARETCDECGKRFATRQQVAKHASVVHCEARLSFKCDTGCLHYTSKQGLQDHLASQHEGRGTGYARLSLWQDLHARYKSLQTKKSSKH
ncbi:hypothetical protein DPMN_013496 [Dreissena polymorpha]|uniref:C2H2-type domain-containing protein n=1 Tax=Dreissena polymorpha TaxID=45954 RepID=A0A9D4S4D5_DREPO|nr:hypothetical protein DPMN_013496 [Dreissena polymorpha]